jgi:hypothetical protein
VKANHSLPVRAAGVIAVILTGAVTLAGCGGHTSAAAKARASAAATSTVAQAGKTDAQQLFAHCIPSTATGQLALLSSKTARDAVLTCGGVPVGKTPADKAARKTAEACALNGVEHGGKLHGSRQDKEGELLTDVYPCVQKYQAGVAGTPDPSGTATPAATGTAKPKPVPSGTTK